MNYKNPAPVVPSKPIPLEQNLQLLEAIGQNPQITQADLAAHLGVAVGTVNWYLKRMIAKGYVKIRRLQRRRLLYLLTPQGLAEKSRLGLSYAQASLRMYRETRQCALDLLFQARQAGFDDIRIDGDGDLAEICRLTCLEQNVHIARSGDKRVLPVLKVDGAHVFLQMPDIPASGRIKSNPNR